LWNPENILKTTEPVRDSSYSVFTEWIYAQGYRIFRDAEDFRSLRHWFLLRTTSLPDHQNIWQGLEVFLYVTKYLGIFLVGVRDVTLASTWKAAKPLVARRERETKRKENGSKNKIIPSQACCQ
jgi:hypothetical protein